MRRTVGMVFQDADDQLFMPTVYDDVAFGPLNLGLPVGEVETVVMQALETMGVPHLKDRPPYKLSGGELQWFVRKHPPPGPDPGRR